MTAHIISLADFRRHAADLRTVPEGSDFTTLFSQARELAFLQKHHSEKDISVMDWSELHIWFQSKLADQVFKKKLFSESVIVSICFVAELLVLFAKNECPPVTISGHLDNYITHGNPQYMLDAANSAFLIFVFWPETRTLRPLKYRKYAHEYGPSLYANYGMESRKLLGYRMAEAFEPLGTIAREVLLEH
jgi:hypothetical protein